MGDCLLKSNYTQSTQTFTFSKIGTEYWKRSSGIAVNIEGNCRLGIVLVMCHRLWDISIYLLSQWLSLRREAEYLVYASVYGGIIYLFSTGVQIINHVISR